MNRADVVVIGAGVLGASVAYHLARAGVERVVVVERDASPGGGSTGRATGGFRALHGSEILARLSVLARRQLEGFADETGVDPHYRPVGYLFAASDDDGLARLGAAGDCSAAAGVPAIEPLDAAGVRARNPLLADSPLVGGAWCAWGGTLEPPAILEGYLTAAARAGVTLRTDCGATAITQRAGRVTGVRTARGTIRAPLVVDAAGAWAATLPGALGVALGVAPLRRQVAVADRIDGTASDMPLTVFTDDGFHFRVRDDALLLLWPGDTGEPLTFDTTFDPAWLDGLRAHAARHVPPLADARIDVARSWTGLYEVTPDRHPLLGPMHAIDGLHVLAGASGHGVMHAPALGLLLAEQIVHGAARSLDATPLRPSRFLDREPIASIPLL